MAVNQLKRRLDKVDAQVPLPAAQCEFDLQRLSVEELEELMRIVSIIELNRLSIESLPESDKTFIERIEAKVAIN
jgi:hypothetical protein